MIQEELHNYQLKKAKEIVQYSIQNAPYFKKLFSGYILDDIWNLPTTNKKLMMDNFTVYNAIGFEKPQRNLNSLKLIRIQRDFKIT